MNRKQSMKNINKIIFFIPILFLSCGNPNDSNKKTIVKNNNELSKSEQKEKERLERRKKIEEEEKVDSLRLDKVLNEALKVARQNFNNDKFKKQYEVFLDDSSTVKVQMNSDYYFTNKYSHLIIRRKQPNNVFIDIYSKINGKFQRVISHKQWEMTYINDKIKDINGDGQRDFIVNWYGSTGCCLKGFSNVYLLRSDQQSFSKDLEFINPTFSPQEKMIRGICYGHPGETEMYKYKWNGEKVDTLEYISYEKTEKGQKTGKIISSTSRPFKDGSKAVKVLNSIPIEYKKIEGIDWFTGKGY